MYINILPSNIEPNEKSQLLLDKLSRNGNGETWSSQCLLKIFQPSDLNKKSTYSSIQISLQIFIFKTYKKKKKSIETISLPYLKKIIQPLIILKVH